MYLFTWAGLVSIPNFPYLKKKKKKEDWKLFLKAFGFFCQTERERWLGAEDIWLQNAFFQCQGPNSEHFLERAFFFFFFWDLGRVNDIIFEQTVWIVSYYWHIIQKSKQTRMRYGRGEGETHHFLGKSEQLKLCLLQWNCNFYSASDFFCGSTWKAVKPE